MKNFSLLLCIMLSTVSVLAQTPDFSNVGFATMNGGTTGGNSATSIIDVYTAAELEAAIGTKKVGGQTPRIIRVNGTIDNGGSEIPIKECSNLTIFGADENALISKTPLIVTSSSNIIIRNLKFTMTGAGGGKDIIEIKTTSSNFSRNIWIDHCEFYNETPTVAGANSNSIKDKYDGLLDIKNNSEYITISWCYFHDHYKAVLVGFTDTDTYDRKITMHHNRFERINSRIPSYRGGTAHIYNNYFEGWVEDGNSQGTCIHTREGCTLLVENNYFTKINRAVYWEPKDAGEGFATGVGNYFASDVKNGFTSAAGENLFTPAYGDVYQDNAMDVPALVSTYAGVGVIKSYDDYGSGPDLNALPTVSITSPQAGSSFESPANVTISADASDVDGSVSKVEFYSNNLLVATLTDAPYSYELEGLTPGKYVLWARSYDDKGRFVSRSVIASVIRPVLEVGASIFGTTPATGDYFWFGAGADKIRELMTETVISGTASFDPNKAVTDYTKNNGALILPSTNGTAIFSLSSCTVFKLFLTRTGDFAGNIYVTTNDQDWGAAVAVLSGKKGSLEVDFSEYATSPVPIFVKIENTSGGGLNIHGADIRLAANTTSIGDVVTSDKAVVSVKYYTLMGIPVKDVYGQKFYIQENVYDDGSVERLKVMNR